jgi:hypothetical protein
MADLNWNFFNGNATAEVEEKTSELYKVSYKNGKNNVYNSVIRFIPNPVDPTKSIYKKYVAWVYNPISQVGMYVDNFSSPTQHSAITDMFFKMKNTKVPAFEEMAKKCVSSKVQYASFVQILSDEYQKDLVGKIKVFTYGQKIYDKIHNEEYPVQGVGINPFHPVYGRHFSLCCTNQSNFNNFDNSNFFDEKNEQGQTLASGMWYLNPTTGQMEIATDATDINVLMNYLNDNCTDLSKYDYAEHRTPEQEKHVAEVLEILNNYMLTGQLVSPQTAVMQQASAVLHTQSNPTFPGVTAPVTPVAPAVSPAAVPPVMPGVAPVMPQPAVSPVMPAPQPAVSPVMPAPQAAVPPVMPGVVPSAPAAPVMPGVAPAPAPVMPGAVAPQPTIAGVEIPTVTPQPNYGAAPATPGTAGINMDDILKQL